MEFSEILDVRDFVGVKYLTLSGWQELDQVKLEFDHDNIP